MSNDLTEPRLTEREREIVTQVANGEPVKAIATSLQIGCRTVEWHLSEARRKLDAKSTPHLVKVFMSAGNTG